MSRLINFITILFSISLSAQVTDQKPTVFLDCQTNCFLTYLRQEVTFINYKRERQGADAYVLVTDQSASAGSREIQLIFIYNDDQADEISRDTIIYYRPANISDAEERDLFKSNFKKGVLPMLINSTLIDQLDYSVDMEEANDLTNIQEKDPWDFWSFNLSLNLNINGEQSFKEERYFGRLSASRVTERSKLVSSTWYDLRKSEFTLSDSSVVKSENQRLRTFFQYVRSVSDHWSVGIRSLAGSSSFGNTDFEAIFRPAVEYNVYPYDENNTRRFSFLYSAGLVHNNYTEETVFDKLKETLWRHSLDIEYTLIQQWGDISFDIELDQYLHDLDLYSVSFNPNVELNIVKGLRLEFGGFLSYVGDRINISKSEISDEDIILQNRQLNTSYSYFSYFGFSYRFGSQNNNIVNPRF